MQPIGKNDALVSVCEGCNDPLKVNVGKRAPLRVTNVVRAVEAYQKLTGPERARQRRETNRALNRCINHPISGKRPPHEMPKPGQMRCDRCADVHRKGLGR